MDSEPDIRSLRLSSLPSRSRRLLSILMNSPKIIPSDGPDKLPRDWRGLAYLVKISSEVAASFQDSSDKTSKVLEIWMQDNNANLGHLLDFLQRLDRYDVYDDLCKDVREHYQNGDLVVNQSNQLQLKNNNQVMTINEWDDGDVITFDDRPGYQHQYDAFVLYADQDQEFVDEMTRRMGIEGFELCTKDNVLPGHATQYRPVAHLISERCKRIILVFSPDFLRSPADSFFRDYAQAVSIESRVKKIIPVLYRDCILPPHLSLYFMLRFNEGRAMYNFWQKLKHTLELSRMPGLYIANSVHSGLNIVELSSDNLTNEYDDNNFFLPRSISMNDVHRLNANVPTDDSQSLNSVIQNGDERKKKPGTLKKILNTLKKKKCKKDTAERCSLSATDES